jgi:ribonuclease P protein component
VTGACFVVVALERTRDTSLPPTSRLGITVSRKVGRAVVRNRVKRRIREWFRASRSSLGPGFDLVVIGRPAAAHLSRTSAEEELSRLGRGAVERRPSGGSA